MLPALRVTLSGASRKAGPSGRWRTALSAAVLFLAASTPTAAERVKVLMNKVSPSGPGEKIGYVTLEDTAQGLSIVPLLKDLPPGPHGFHVHENPSCAPAMKDGRTIAAGAAGGHFDPRDTRKHRGPLGDGHLGDLPVLQVDPGGAASMPMTAPRLTVNDVQNRSLVIHAGGDNYSDDPKPLGGGGARIACGALGS